MCNNNCDVTLLVTRGLLLHVIVTCYMLHYTSPHTLRQRQQSGQGDYHIYDSFKLFFYTDYIILFSFCGVFSHVLLYCETRQIVIRKPDLHQEPNDTINIECQRRHSDTVRQHKTEDLF